MDEQSAGVDSITPVNLAVRESCPADISVPTRFKTYAISYKPICDVSGWLKPLVLAFAWIAAVLIVIGGFKNA